MQSLYRYHYLTSLQVARLVYTVGALTHARSRLRRLVELGLVQKTLVPTISGKPPARFCLTRRGYYSLAQQGFPLPRRINRPSEAQESYRYAKHTQAVNDVLISLELLCRSDSRLTLSQLLHEREWFATPLRVELPASWIRSGEAQKAVVIPDGWVDLHIEGVGRMPLLVELDRGTEEQWKWRKKVRGLVAAALGPYQQQFGTNSLTVVVVAAPGEERFQPTDPRPRLRNLLSWTSAELSTIGHEHLADLFRFTWLYPDQIEPAEAFLSARWYRPFDPTPVALLPLGEEVNKQ